ncbi:MAG: signal peptidase I, partial [Blastocatellia bacterium]|nr:signal peptidase I [Blastocatellia bacterium]
RGDIIVFKYPENPSINYVKRVIGLPGESVEVRDTKILINGQELPEHIVNAEPHVTNSAKDFNKTDDKAPLDISPEQDAAPQNSLKYKAYYSKELRAEEFYLDDRKPAGQKYGVGEPFKIPDGHYFVMGDNRDNSQDSRYWGTVPRENVVGKAFVVYWSLDQSRDSEGNETSGNFLVDIFTRTRWSRMGTLIK